MKYKNSYFQIIIKDDGTYIQIFPALNDGKKLEYKEIFEFLDAKGILIDDKKLLKETVENQTNEICEVKLMSTQVRPFGESAKVIVSNDSMVGYIRFYPPSTGGKLMSKQEILNELTNEKIKFGIIDKVIDVYLSSRQFCLNIPVAKGEKPVMARDAVIDYYFETSPMAKPKLLEDGSVDYHSLSIFTPVNKGDMLAKLTPFDAGKPGRDIYGRVVQQNKPKVKKLKYGRNIKISEDETTIYSEVDGNVTLTNGMVFVSDTYNVAADVDASTGDIDYEGNVCIAGTVKTGFTVKAGGDIQVNGAVEGATLIAGGNIMIKQGVQGMSKGYIEANGDICAQFFESANAKAGGSIYAGSVLHSTLNCEEKIIVSGRKGFIIGGEINCQTYIEVNNIGNKMETQTSIKVGVKPELQEELKVLVKAVTEYNEKIEELSSYLNVYKEKLKKGAKLSPENLKQIKIYNSQLEEVNNEKKGKAERLVEIKTEISNSRKGKIKVLGNTFRGVVISIGGLTYVVSDKDTHCLYSIKDGEIAKSPF